MVFLRQTLLVVSLIAGCSFSPGLDGIYACGEDDACPPALHCGPDRRCIAVPPSHDLAPADLTGVDVVGDDLAYPDIARPDLARPDLSHGDLAHPDLARADLAHHADLAQHVDLAHTDLTCVKKSCGKGQCEDAPDGCGGKLSCGMCRPPLVCGARTPNVCDHF